MSGVLHLGYALALQGGYGKADLSIVYPVARGTGPTLSVAGAILLLGEPCTWPIVPCWACGACHFGVFHPVQGNRGFADSPLEGDCVDALRGSRAFLAWDCHAGCRFVSGLFARQCRWP